MPKIVNPVGNKYGRLTVLSFHDYRGHKKRYVCQCDCGKQSLVICGDLIRKKNPTVSCGCYRAEQVSKAKTTHGQGHCLHPSPAYRSWRSMKQRCLNPNNKDYKRGWGGIGIKICERWLESFENFYSDMGDRPKGTTLDRIDNNKDYEPSNCKWSTPKEQANNRSSNV